MGFVTYILLSGLLLGRSNRFHPALLGSTASTALAVLIFETLLVRLGCYLLGVGQEGGEGWADVVAVLGYKFLGICGAMVVKVLVPVPSVAYGVFVYAAFAHGFFLVSRFSLFFSLDSVNDSALFRLVENTEIPRSTGTVQNGPDGVYAFGAG
jgi:hypothetical protein